MTASTPATAQTVSTQTSLLDAAEALFSERGFGGVSTREIVERAGANIAAIKYHFGSKEGLYRAVLQRAMNKPQAAEIWSALPEPGGLKDANVAAEAMSRFIRGFLQHVIHEASQDAAPSLLCREALEPSEAFNEMIEGYIKPRVARIESAIKLLRPGIEGDELKACGQGILGMVLHYKSFFEIQASLWLGHDPDADRVDSVAKALAAFTLRGLGCNEALVTTGVAAIDAEREEAR